MYFSLHGIYFATLHQLEILKSFTQILKKNLTASLIVADVCTFCETKISHKRSRNNLTSPQAITVKLEPLTLIDKNTISHVCDMLLHILCNLRTRMILI